MSITSSADDEDLESQGTACEADGDLISKAEKVEEETGDSSTTSSSVIISSDETGADAQIIQSVELSSALLHVSINMESTDAKLQQDSIARIVEEKDLESLQKFGGVKVIAEALGSDIENGLSSDEQDQVRAVPPPQTPIRDFLIHLLKACNDYTVWLLVIAAGLSLSFGMEGMPGAFLDGIITAVLTVAIVALNYLKGDVSKMSGEPEPSKVSRKVVVKRRGHHKEVSCSDVLVGDIVLLDSECWVPADGLFFEYGESLWLEFDDGSTVDAKQPFLFYGAKVMGGSGGMLVTSVGSNTVLGRPMSQVKQNPGMTPLLLELDKVNTVLYIIGLLIPILILIALFLLWKLEEEDVSSIHEQFKGKPSPVNKAINEIFKRSNQKFNTLIQTLTMSLLGVKGAIPYVITHYIDYWQKKMLSSRVFSQEPLACLTMALVSTICIDKATWLRLNRRTVDMEALRNAGVKLILVSEDKAPRLEALGLESNGLVTTGENFRNYSNKERMNEVDNIIVMGGCTPFDKLHLMQCMKEKGKRVAMVGGRTNEIPALKEADVGVVMEICSNEMARESSDIIIRDDDFSYFVTMVSCGRCTYDNIRKYIQFQLTMAIAGLLIPTITTTSFGYSPISVIHLLWANTVASFLGGLALRGEPPAKALMDKPPQRQTKALITKAMWRNIVSQALYQTAILVFFQSKGKVILGINEKVSDTIIFNSFVLCQVFNIVNARELEKKNLFKGIHHNPRLLVALGVILVLQVGFLEISHLLIRTENLSWEQWLVCLLIGIILLVIDWATKCTSGFVLDGMHITGPFGSGVGTVDMTPSALSPSASNINLQLINGNGNTDMSCHDGIRVNDAV